MLTIEQFEAAVLNCPDVYNPVPFKINWGRPKRGQGKRVKGMVIGSMSDAPAGEKTYYNSFGELPDRAEIIVDIKYMTWETGRYIKARDFGLGHHAAKCFSLMNTKKAYEMYLEQKGAE